MIFKKLGVADAIKHGINGEKATTVCDIMYKSRELVGIGKYIFYLTDEEKNVIGQTDLKGINYRIFNVLLQEAHNSMVDKNIFSLDIDKDNKPFFKSSLEKIMSKVNITSKGRVLTLSNAKDARYIKNLLLSISCMVFKASTDEYESSISVVPKLYIERNDNVYFTLDGNIIHAMKKGYSGEVFDKNIKGYFTLPIKEVHSKDLKDTTMLLNELVLSQNFCSTFNDGKKMYFDDFRRIITNSKDIKNSAFIKTILMPSIIELEEKLGIRLYVVFELFSYNNKIKEVHFKPYMTNSYMNSEFSKSSNSPKMPHIDTIIDWNIFYMEKSVYDNSILTFELDELKDLAEKNKNTVELV